MAFVIPLSNDPAQRFEVTLNNTRYFFTVKYNYNADFWTFSLEDSTEMLIEGVPMLPGINMLWPHEDLTFGQLWMVDQTEKNIDPDGDNIGDIVKLIYYPPGEEPDLPTLEDLSNANAV